MTKRQLALEHMRIAGVEGDEKKWTRLYVESRIGYEAARAAWSAGRAAVRVG